MPVVRLDLQLWFFFPAEDTGRSNEVIDHVHAKEAALITNEPQEQRVYTPKA